MPDNESENKKVKWLMNPAFAEGDGFKFIEQILAPDGGLTNEMEKLLYERWGNLYSQLGYTTSRGIGKEYKPNEKISYFERTFRKTPITTSHGRPSHSKYSIQEETLLRIGRIIDIYGLPKQGK